MWDNEGPGLESDNAGLYEQEINQVSAYKDRVRIVAVDR